MTNSRFAIIGALVLFSGLVLLAVLAVRNEPGKGAKARRGKQLARTVAEGIAVSQSRYLGIDLIRCGKCRLEKMHKGPISFGAFNELVLEDLEVVLPPSEDNEVHSGDRREKKRRGSELLERLGATPSFLRSQGRNLRFSSVRIEGLKISKLEDGTNVVAVLEATKATIGKDGESLRLNGCKVSGESAQGAHLRLDNNRLRLEWKTGAIDL